MTMLLDLFYDRYDDAAARRLVVDAGARAAAMTALGPELERAGMTPGALASAEGAALFVSVLTLRVKFPLEEARARVALNIAMREGRA
jgi:hypothetical protein